MGFGIRLFCVLAFLLSTLVTLSLFVSVKCRKIKRVLSVLRAMHGTQ